MTQSAPPVEQMQPMVLAIVTMVEMVTTKQENVTVLSDSFMSQCSLTSFGMFFCRSEPDMAQHLSKFGFVLI